MYIIIQLEQSICLKVEIHNSANSWNLNLLFKQFLAYILIINTSVFERIGWGQHLYICFMQHLSTHFIRISCMLDSPLCLTLTPYFWLYLTCYKIIKWNLESVENFIYYILIEIRFALAAAVFQKKGISINGL